MDPAGKVRAEEPLAPRVLGVAVAQVVAAVAAPVRPQLVNVLVDLPSARARQTPGHRRGAVSPVGEAGSVRRQPSAASAAIMSKADRRSGSSCSLSDAACERS